MSENNYKKLVYNTAIFAVGNFGSKILTFLIVPLYTYVLTTAEYGTIVVRTFNQIYSEYFRAINQNVKFTIFGLITTATTLGFNVLFLLVFKWGMAGYLYATLLAAVIGTIYILVFSDFFKVVSFKCIDKKNTENDFEV